MLEDLEKFVINDAPCSQIVPPVSRPDFAVTEKPVDEKPEAFFGVSMREIQFCGEMSIVAHDCEAIDGGVVRIPGARKNCGHCSAEFRCRDDFLDGRKQRRLEELENN